MKKFFIERTPMKSSSGWYVPDEDMMLIFGAMGHSKFIAGYLEMDGMVGNKKVDKILSDMRKEIGNKDRIFYSDILAKGWIRFFVYQDVIEIDAKGNPVNFIAELVEELMDYGDSIDIETDRGYASFATSEVPGRKEIARGLAGRYSKVTKKLKSEGLIVDRSTRIARKMLGL